MFGILWEVPVIIVGAHVDMIAIDHWSTHRLRPQRHPLADVFVSL